MPYLTSTSGITVDYYFIKFSTNSSIVDFFLAYLWTKFLLHSTNLGNAVALDIARFPYKAKAGLFADNLCAVNQAESWK